MSDLIDVLVLHGPNLNLLGTREPEIYGTTRLDEIDDAIRARAASLGLAATCEQTNHEGVLVDRIQSAPDRHGAVILNAAAYTHTSVAIRDAVSAARVRIPIVEVHLSDPESREDFRRRNLLAGVVAGRIAGFGALSYLLALEAASTLIRARGVDLRDQ